MDIPETRYAKSVGGVHIAYQAFGAGPFDIVFAPSLVTHVELQWKVRPWAEFNERLGRLRAPGAIGHVLGGGPPVRDHRRTRQKDPAMAGPVAALAECQTGTYPPARAPGAGQRAELVSRPDAWGHSLMVPK